MTFPVTKPIPVHGMNLIYWPAGNQAGPMKFTPITLYERKI